MIAKLFSRGDVCLVAHLTQAASPDPHFPYSEKAVIEFFERATMVDSIAQKIQQQRALLSASERKIIRCDAGDDGDTFYTARGIIRIADAMKGDYFIPASYLKNVMERISREVNNDDKKYIELKKRFLNCMSNDERYGQDRVLRSPSAAVNAI